MGQLLSAGVFFMMKKQIRSKRAFLSFDALFSLLFLCAFMMVLIEPVLFYSKSVAYAIEDQNTLNTLILVSEFCMTSSLVKKENNLIFPNLLDFSKLDSSFISTFSTKTNLNLSFGDGASGHLCISRLGVDSTDLSYKKLKICEGNHADS
jgi:hypothetical protein